MGSTTKIVAPIDVPATRRASFSPGVGMANTNGTRQPPRVTVPPAKTPRLSRLETPRDCRCWEISPPASTATMPKIQGSMLRSPAIVWL